MTIKLFRNTIAMVLSILIFTVLIKLDYGYATSSFISIIGGLFLRVYLYKNYQFIYQKVLLILFVSFISILMQNLCLVALDLKLRFSQLIAILFCYVIYSVLDSYVESISKYIIKISKIANVACKHSLFITIKTIENPLTEKWLVRSIWAISVSMIAFIIFYMLPHRGFDYTDSGYQLYNVYNIAHGVVPGAGYAALINLPLYFAGLNYYLAYEIYYCFIAMLSVFLIFYAFDKHKSVMLPITMVLVLTCNMTYILSYATVTAYTITIAFSLLLISNKNNSLLLSLAGSTLLSFSCFTNIALTPGLLFLAITFLFLKNHKLLNFCIYIATSSILFYFYINSDVNIFNHSGAAASINLIYNIWLTFFTIFLDKNYYFIIIMVIATFFKIFTNKYNPANNKKYWPVLLLFFLSTTIVAVNWSCIARGFNFSLENRLSILQVGLIELQILIIAIILLYKNEKKHLTIILFFLLMFILTIGLSSATHSGQQTSHIAKFAKAYLPLLTLLLLLNNQFKATTTIASISRLTTYLFLMTLLLLSFTLQLNSNYGSSKISLNNTYIKEGFLKGIYTTENKLKSYKDIMDFYENNNCSVKNFIAFGRLPLAYLLVDRKAYGNQPMVNPRVGNNVTPETQLKHIKEQSSWCAILPLSYNGYTEPYKLKIRSSLEDWGFICYHKTYENDSYGTYGNTPVDIMYCYK